MAQMRTPNTALATTSAIEYPTCSYAVATGPARPTILIMYTPGYVSHETAVRYLAATMRPLADSGCLFVASFSPVRSVCTTYMNGNMAHAHQKATERVILDLARVTKSDHSC